MNWTRWKNFKELLASNLFPSYLDRVKPLKEAYYAEEIQGSLPFQMLIYFNIYFFPFWWVGIIGSWWWKVF
jgi:hypothetical protein